MKKFEPRKDCEDCTDSVCMWHWMVDGGTSD
jgi:hypothetical protein